MAVLLIHHLKTNTKVQHLPTLQYYYEVSSCQEVAFGNTDSIGIYRAYQVLNENPTNTDLKLSDVFTLYYKGAGALRSGISLLATPTFNRFTLANRWKIFSLFYGFLEEPSAGSFNWIPDDATKFANLKAPYNSTTNPTGKDYDNRLYNFAEFWYNTREEYYSTAFNLIFETDFWSISRLKSSGNFESTGKSEKQWMLDELQVAFETLFLTSLKNYTI